MFIVHAVDCSVWMCPVFVALLVQFVLIIIIITIIIIIIIIIIVVVVIKHS